MTKRDPLKRQVAIVAEVKLLEMPTKQLLGRLKRLRFCEESFQGSDLTEREIEACTGILFKDTPEWKKAYEEVKRVLAMREHIRRNGERKSSSK